MAVLDVVIVATQTALLLNSFHHIQGKSITPSLGIRHLGKDFCLLGLSLHSASQSRSSPRAKQAEP